MCWNWSSHRKWIHIGGLTTAAIAFALKGLWNRENFSKKDKVLVVQSYERNGLIGDIGHVLGSLVTIKDIKIVRMWRM